MEIRLNRAELLAELVPMQGIVERRTTIPALSHLLLTVSEDGLHLAATDLDVSLTSFCDGEVKSPARSPSRPRSCSRSCGPPRATTSPCGWTRKAS